MGYEVLHGIINFVDHDDMNPIREPVEKISREGEEHGISDSDIVSSDDAEDVNVVICKARKAWSVGKKVGLTFDDDAIAIQALVEDSLEKKITSKNKQRSRGRGKRKPKKNKQGEDVCSL